ncbi:BatD family protein [Aliamphritea spongicola]|nr:BatD family protein [Aliamphritea spongicola]
MKSVSFKTIALAAAVTAAGISPALLAAGLDARLNAQKVAVGDNFQLILSTRDPQAAAPDLTPLEKDFSVQGTSQSMQTSIINGRKSAQQSWIITLAAKHTGELTIPAISAGAVSSDSTSVRVVDISEMPRAIGADGISVTVSLADQAQHYIYQEIPLTVRMEIRQPVQQATLIAPQSPDFELTQNGEDRLIQGQGVNIIERDYLLRPQTSGALTLGPFVLQGKWLIPGRQGRRFQVFRLTAVPCFSSLALAVFSVRENLLRCVLT